MGFDSGNTVSNIFIFLAGLCGVFNFRVAYRTLKNGTTIEMLVKENIEIRKENKELSQENKKLKDDLSKLGKLE